MPHIRITVNGETHEAEVDARRLLVDFLREDLRLTGTHVGCDTSQCGACLIHLDGAPAKACTMLAAEAEGAEITTIEGLADGDTLHPMQEAFREYHGLQCGFCTPGMIMSGVALLKENPKPSEAEVRQYLEGNMCRCTGYQNIVKAIIAASGQDAGPVVSEGVKAHV